MKCEIISIGTEILLGDILNTNAQYLSQMLAEIGIDVYYTIAVGDNMTRIIDVVNKSLSRSDMIITTGGLGPTDDDISKEAVAQALGFEMALHEPSMEVLRKSFEGRIMPECNIKQAIMPLGSIVLPNANGTAPACIMEKDGKIAIVLPGPPKEMKPLFEEQVRPYLLAKNENIVIKSKTLKVTNIGESAIQELLQELFDTQTNPSIAPYAKERGTQLRITAKTDSEEEADRLIDTMYVKVEALLGDNIYSVNDDELEDIVIKGLTKLGKTLSLAESCTGGMVTSQLISVQGASEVVKSGVICYSNEAKIKQVGVSELVLEKYHAVSEETAIEMAKGIRNVSNTDIGIGITGIAGPDGGSVEKPVGLVYIAIADKDGAYVYQHNGFGSRERIRKSTMLKTMNLIRLKYCK